MIIPWATDNPCAHRKAALAWTVSRWAATGHEVVVGEHAGPWCKAAAVADGLRRAHGDVLVIADADCWSDGIPDAIAAVASGAPWAIPHGKVHRLTHGSTRQVLDGRDPAPSMGLAEAPMQGWPGGGLAVLSRDLYEQVPLDPRYVGWGQEDESWARALTVLAGRPWRGTSPLWHLWHPPQERMTRRWGNPAGRQLSIRYQQTRTPQAMRALLTDAHQAV